MIVSKFNTKCLLASFALAAFTFAPTGAMAQSDSSIEIEGDVSFVTNYSHRGLSRSGGGVAVQGNLYIFSDSGLSGGIFASSLDNEFFGYDAEIEIYADYSGMLGAYDYRLSASYDSFHGGGESHGYANFKASLARDFGLVYLNAGAAYTPSKREIGDGSSFYKYVDVEVPIPLSNGPSLSLGVHLGHESFEGGLKKWDWRTGLYLGVLDYEVGVQYTGSNNDTMVGSGERVMLLLKRYF